MQAFCNPPAGGYEAETQAHHARTASYFEPMTMDRASSTTTSYGYIPLPASTGMHGAGNANPIKALTQGFGGMSMQSNMSMDPLAMHAAATQGANTRLNAGPAQYQGGVPVLLVNSGGVVYATPAPGYRQPALVASPGLSTPGFGSFDQSMGHFSRYNEHGSFANGYQHLPVVTQARGQLHHGDGLPSDTPSFGDHKSSLGSNNGREASSSPDTPYLSTNGHADRTVIIAREDNSPQTVGFDYRTPSPQTMLPAYDHSLMMNPMAIHGAMLGKDATLARRVVIPPAITAVYESRVTRKSLEASLHNANGTTNVYIRGFSPETDDAMLLSYAVQFGRVVTSKAMIDQQTGACKGFGFACYQTFPEAENCIRGFYSLGYDESFNARLKALSDPSSTNLYVSNLPRSMTEAELAAVFIGYTVESSRIQRDENGNSKGVGFARFQTRKECDDVIQKFNGELLGQERLPFQVRYADTAEQKRFKAITQERRDYKSGEYNSAAYGALSHPMYPLRAVFGGPGSSISSAPLSRRSGSSNGMSSYTSLNGKPLHKSQVMVAQVPSLDLGATAQDAAPADVSASRGATSRLSSASEEVNAGECVTKSPAKTKGPRNSPSGSVSGFRG